MKCIVRIEIFSKRFDEKLIFARNFYTFDKSIIKKIKKIREHTLQDDFLPLYGKEEG